MIAWQIRQLPPHSRARLFQLCICRDGRVVEMSWHSTRAEAVARRDAALAVYA